jgi:5-methylcytosine-specific restriction protein A
MTDEFLNWLKDLINKKNLHPFYTSSKWINLRAEVLKELKSECQECNKHGMYKRADTVHHVQYVKKHPHLSLSKFYNYNGKEYRNLIPLCSECHNKVHNRTLSTKKLLTIEKW